MSFRARLAPVLEALGIPTTGSRYRRAFEKDLKIRSQKYRPLERKIRFSVITSVYEKTEPQYFEEMIRSVECQTFEGWDLVILGHGSLSDEVVQILNSHQNHPKIKVYRQSKNLGIVGAMRFCLEHSAGDFVVPIDADDLITSDALEILAGVIEKTRARYVYSDEDHLINGRPAEPFQRSDWDPVLGLETSYIWHLTAFHRAEAERLGVYSDPRSEWCHDWDTLLRFSRAGIKPVHVPEILYHWRQHSKSSTNRAQPEAQSLASQKNVLVNHLEQLGLAENFVLDPVTLGSAKQWRIARKTLGTIPAQMIRQKNKGVPDPKKFSAEFLVFLDENVRLDSLQSVWSAITLFELHPEIAIVSGRITGSDKIIGGGRILNGKYLVCPSLGLHRDELGPFAMNQKAHCVSVPEPALFVVRSEFTAQALRIPEVAEFLSIAVGPRSFALALAAVAAQRGLSVAEAPQMLATLASKESTQDTLSAAEMSFIAAYGAAVSRGSSWTNFFSRYESRREVTFQ